MPGQHRGHMPADVSEHVGLFDRFADAVARFTSRSWFFALCVLLVVVWAPSILVLQNLDTWQLIINTATTIITFLLVALLQNTQTRADKAMQGKDNAIAGGVLLLLMVLGHEDSDEARELRAAIGLETRESSEGRDER